MKVGLVWFKNDLRLHDNEAVCRALAECDRIVYCYCLESSWYQPLKLGFRKTDINRFKFLEQSVLSLQAKLVSLGGHLVIGASSASEFIPWLIKKHGIVEVFAESEYSSEELSLIEKVKTNSKDVIYNFYWGKTLYHIDDIPFSIEGIPLTSKAYRIPVSKKSSPREVYRAPEDLKALPKIESSIYPSYVQYGFTEQDYRNAQPYLPGGEDAGLERLKHYTLDTELLTGYRWSRNKSMGLDYSSKFSPYLALGCVSAREIYKAVKLYEQGIKKNQSTWWIIFEHVWRDYFTFKNMRFGSKIFRKEGFKNKVVNFDNDTDHFHRWCEGQTGIPFVDAHMRQLNQTGYMSNRGRVNCASYLIHDLRIDWTWGAAYFESKLIDYDVSSNWMNWHVQAFEIYYTNPVHQSNKYKAQRFIREWIPQLSDHDDVEILIPWEYPLAEYPRPVEIYKKWTRSINLIKSALIK